MDELAQKDQKTQGKAKNSKVTGLESENDQASEKSDDFDLEDDDEQVVQWNRAVAENIYNETRVNLEAMYNNLAKTQEFQTEFD